MAKPAAPTAAEISAFIESLQTLRTLISTVAPSLAALQLPSRRTQQKVHGMLAELDRVDKRVLKSAVYRRAKRALQREVLKADILDSFRTFHASHGRVPTMAECGSTNNLPGANSIRYLFGTFNTAVFRAGLNPNKPGRTRSRLPQ